MLHQTISAVTVIPPQAQFISTYYFFYLFFLMLYSLYGVWSAEPCICPSPLISRCSPDLAAYRCLWRTTCPHPLAICGPWSGRGTETTPAKKKILEKDTVTMMRSNMFPENLYKRSVAALLHWLCAGTS